MVTFPQNVKLTWVPIVDLIRDLQNVPEQHKLDQKKLKKHAITYCADFRNILKAISLAKHLKSLKIEIYLCATTPSLLNAIKLSFLNTSSPVILRDKLRNASGLALHPSKERRVNCLNLIALPLDSWRINQFIKRLLLSSKTFSQSSHFNLPVCVFCLLG